MTLTNATASPAKTRQGWEWPSGKAIARVTGIYVGSRLLVGFVILCSIWVSNGQQSIYKALTRWDSAWYGFIATQGYPDFLTEESGGNRWAFFPAWPMLLRVTHAVFGGTWQRNGLIWAAILGLVSAVLLYMLVADVLGEQVAHSSVVLFLVSPATAVLSMVYSEVLFVPCLIACLLMLGRQRWILAGLAAALAGGARIGGVALIAACLFEAIRTYRRSGSLRPFLAPALAPLGIVGFFVHQRLRTGSWDAYFTAQHFWGNGNSAGGPVLKAFGRLATTTAGWRDPPTVIVSLLVLAAAAGAVALWRTAGVPHTWWIVTIILTGIAVSPALIYSVPRLLLPAFLLLVGVAAKTPARWFPTVVAASAVSMGALGIMYFNTVGFVMAP